MPSPTRIYRVSVERYRTTGAELGWVDDVLENGVYDFLRFAPACAKARAVLTTYLAPQLASPEDGPGIIITRAEVWGGHFESDNGEPLPPITLEEYGAIISRGEAIWVWDTDFETREYQQKVLADMLAEAARLHRLANG
jgi:hypothetical protein